MDLKLKGQKALVTGGSKGIGLAVAKQLSLEGCDVELEHVDQVGLEPGARQPANFPHRAGTPELGVRQVDQLGEQLVERDRASAAGSDGVGPSKRIEDQRRVIGLEYSEQSDGRTIPDDQMRFYLDQVRFSRWTFSSSV